MLWNYFCSVFQNYLERTCPGHLLGDSGYPLRGYLMTPILQPTSLAQEKYNKAHAKGRVVVERAFGVLKSRFRYGTFYFFFGKFNNWYTIYTINQGSNCKLNDILKTSKVRILKSVHTVFLLPWHDLMYLVIIHPSQTKITGICQWKPFCFT